MPDGALRFRPYRYGFSAGFRLECACPITGHEAKARPDECLWCKLPLSREVVSIRFSRQSTPPLTHSLIAMSLPALLTRLLLIASLILNGSGYALAADVGMAMQSHAHASMDKDVGKSAKTPPCHEAMSEGDLAQAPMDNESTGPGNVPAGKVPAAEDPDCCKAGSCPHACHQQLAQAANTVVYVSAAMVRSLDSTRPFPAAHDAPALHRLIRPPIA